MIRYSVRWSEIAERKLVQFWYSSTEAGVITRAMTDLERKLSSEPRPEEADEIEGLWFLDSDPLRVTYEIDDRTRTVSIVNTGLLRRR